MPQEVNIKWTKTIKFSNRELLRITVYSMKYAHSSGVFCLVYYV